jgi:hypothetical protein
MRVAACCEAVSGITEALAEVLLPVGFNLIGVAAVEDYDRRVTADRRLAVLHPAARSVVVIGNGGGAMWRAFQECRRRDERILDRENPLDEFTVEAIDAEVPSVFSRFGASFRTVYPFRFREDPVSFMDLAAAAGLGAPSILGVLIHPVFGPWMALRAAVLTDASLTAPRPAAGFDPCPGCIERPCISACPGSVVRYPQGWDIPGCVAHRSRTGDCADRCHARVACVYGPAHRYPDDELAYHHRRSWAQMKKRCQEPFSARQR